MRRVDVLVIGSSSKAIAVADHALSLGLSTAIASAESVTSGNRQPMHEIYECATLSLDVKSRTLQAEGSAYRVELGFVSLIIAPELAVGLQAKDGNPHESLENSVYISGKDDNQCHEKFFTDECMEILMIRNAQILARPNSLLSLCSPSVLEYLQVSANLKIHIYDFNCSDSPDKFLRTCQAYRPVDPIALAKISTVTKGKEQITLSICERACRRGRAFFQTNIPRIYVLGTSYPAIQQADEIFRRQVFPYHLYQQKHLHNRMSIEYSPGRKVILYGKQQKTLCKNRSMYIAVRLQARGDPEQISEVYLTQLGIVLGFVLFLPEMTDLVAPLTLCCDNSFSIIRLLHCQDNKSEEIDERQTHLTELVLAYYKEISSDKTVYKALQMSFRHRGVVNVLLLLSPILLLAAFIVCILLIF
ncbi:Hypothetical protein GLP15_5163 [Giardia lamblia P15]|uniref:Uncharacterized protein n=1 Tax=Giardia intestinalis (strain P15) TaxID=658858 RepID=E1EW95_GIAIA|nr:Hypothetical protein GLP15_5163 [Giardia lamblia P15]